MPDKSADSTMDAIKHFKGERNIERFYSDRSGEIDRALRDLHIVPDNSQPGVPQNSAVAERLVQDVLEGTKDGTATRGFAALLLGICLPSLSHYGNALPARQSVAVDGDGDRSSPWENTHDVRFAGNLILNRRSEVSF